MYFIVSFLIEAGRLGKNLLLYSEVLHPGRWVSSAKCWMSKHPGVIRSVGLTFYCFISCSSVVVLTTPSLRNICILWTSWLYTRRRSHSFTPSSRRHLSRIIRGPALLSVIYYIIAKTSPAWHSLSGCSSYSQAIHRLMLLESAWSISIQNLLMGGMFRVYGWGPKNIQQGAYWHIHSSRCIERYPTHA